MWSEPFLTVTKEGRSIAVLFMHTSGLLNPSYSEFDPYTLGFTVSASSFLLYVTENMVTDSDFHVLDSNAFTFSEEFETRSRIFFVVKDWIGKSKSIESLVEDEDKYKGFSLDVAYKCCFI